MRRLKSLLLGVILSVCASAAHAQCTGTGVPTLPAVCSLSAAGVTSTAPPASLGVPANAPDAFIGVMTFTESGCAVTLALAENFNGTVDTSTLTSPLTGTYTMNATGTSTGGIGTITLSNGVMFQIVVDSPGSTAGTETEVRFLDITPDGSGNVTSSILRVGTCKTQ